VHSREKAVRLMKPTQMQVSSERAVGAMVSSRTWIEAPQGAEKAWIVLSCFSGEHGEICELSVMCRRGDAG
jgi:hypothetical protein